MKASAILLAAMIPIVSGCGAWARHTAANNLEESDAAYKQCLAQAGDAGKCAAQKAAYDADVETYEVMRGKKLRQ